MTKLNYIILSSVLLLSLFSCSNSEERTHRPQVSTKNAIKLEIHNYRAKNKIGTLDANKYADRVKFIRLESNGKNFISGPTQVYFDDGKIIIFDKTGPQIYDQEGRFLNKISRKGKGREEYIEIRCATYDQQRNEIVIFDFKSRKILHYNLKGECLKVLEAQDIEDIKILTNGNYLCYNNVANNNYSKYSGLFELDTEGNLVEHYFEYSVKFPEIKPNQHFCIENIAEDVYLTDSRYNELYRYEKSKIETYLSYEITSSLEQELIGKTLEDVLGPISPDRILINMNIDCLDHQIKDNLIYGNWIDPKYDGSWEEQGFYSIFDKNDKSFILFDKVNYGNTDLPVILNKPTATNLSNAFVCFIDESRIKNHLENNDLSPKIRSELEALLTGDEYANPLLEIVYLK